MRAGGAAGGCTMTRREEVLVAVCGLALVALAIGFAAETGKRVAGPRSETGQPSDWNCAQVDDLGGRRVDEVRTVLVTPELSELRMRAGNEWVTIAICGRRLSEY